MGIVTAAAGRRDGYQVPVALAEVDPLAAHVTDQYLPDALQPFLERFEGWSFRATPPTQQTAPFAAAVALAHCSRRLVLTKLAQRLQLLGISVGVTIRTPSAGVLGWLGSRRPPYCCTWAMPTMPSWLSRSSSDEEA